MGPTASEEAARLQKRDEEHEALFQKLREVYPQAAHEHYFVRGMTRSWTKRMLELDIQIIADYRAWCKKRVHATCELTRREDRDVAARDLQAIFSRVARLSGNTRAHADGKGGCQH